ncbi:NAD-dependent epimerase/dehydratase family protein [Desulfovibrio aminophilus]|uniref:NAD-dependent epimerase/dehydratase family protein n=1 Tax=Desulfovibrio aminophilus TaxID=81425 RepID=UPI00041E2371|nr:NAD(P)-dependent oxidoreductase [Desulfovibrio aminophilus]
MRVLITGATGFIGRYVVAALLDLGVPVIAASRSRERAEAMPWFGRVDWRPLDLAVPSSDPFQTLGRPDRCLHLAWSGLPDYRGAHHLEENLPQSLAFLRTLLAGGLRRLLVAGTCFEYGLQEGEFSEDIETRPENAYGRAKDALRRALEPAAAAVGATLQWARLFYMYGPGQNPNSLFSQLDRALDEGRASFDMSGGEQVRDFLPVERLAGYLARVALQDEVAGVINVCSGEPATVRELVQAHVAERGAALTLNLGVYPYPDWEPFRFWGNTAKLQRALSAYDRLSAV